MASAGLVAMNAARYALEVEMSAELGVIRSEYADTPAGLKTFRAARKAAGLEIKTVWTEYTRRTKGGVSTTALRNERWRLQAIAEEEAGLSIYVAGPGEKLTYTQRTLNRLRAEVRLQMGSSVPVAVGASPEPPAAPKPVSPAAEVKPVSPAPKPVSPAAEAKPVSSAPKPPSPAAAPKTASPAPAPKPASPAAPQPVLSAKEAAMMAAFTKEYEEVTLGGKVYLRHRELDVFYVKGEKAGELGDEMPEWDYDLGEWKSE